MNIPKYEIYSKNLSEIVYTVSLIFLIGLRKRVTVSLTLVSSRYALTYLLATRSNLVSFSAMQ